MSKKSIRKWYKLDVSATIYPAVESRRFSGVFRVSMELDEKIDEDLLLEALKNIRTRFPYYQVHLKTGLFWHYLEQNEKDLVVWPDTPSPCERINPSFNNGYLYRVMYYQNHIAVEFFHVLTDGYGGMEFLKCLVHQYLQLSGKVKGNLENIMDIEKNPNEEESKDAFWDVLDKNKDSNIEDKRTLFGSEKVFKINNKLMPLGMDKVVTGVVSMKELKELSEKRNATVTQLLAALYIEAIIHKQAKQKPNLKKHKAIGIQIPVNMRKYYPSRCMRNFSLFVIPKVKPSEISTFDGIIIKVKDFMQEALGIRHLNTMIKDNCKLAGNKLVQHMPIEIKNLAIKYIYHNLGYSGTLSNIGLVRLPKEVAKHVKSANFVIGTSPGDKCICSVLGYNDNVYITFNRNIKDALIERHVFRRLVEMGVNVNIKSN